MACQCIQKCHRYDSGTIEPVIRLCSYFGCSCVLEAVGMSTTDCCPCGIWKRFIPSCGFRSGNIDTRFYSGSIENRCPDQDRRSDALLPTQGNAQLPHQPTSPIGCGE